MKNLRQALQADLQSAFTQAFPDALPADFAVEITRSTQPKFGHYQCNSALKLAKPLRQAPLAIAEAVAAALKASPNAERFGTIEVAKPGFLNLWLSDEALLGVTRAMSTSDTLGLANTSPKQRVVVDFSSPNIAKEMHVGHLRSTVIGDCLARTFEFLGHDVLRLNHLGDWGTAFGMLIAYLKAEHPGIIAGDTSADLSELMNWYREAKQRFDADDDFKKTAQSEVVALQAHEADAYRAWEAIVAISEQAYAEIYGCLDVTLTSRGESFYNEWLPEIVDTLKAKGLVEASDGAQCVYLPGYTNREGDPLPFMIQKSDGGYNYATTDLAALRHRVDVEKADRLIYVTDSGQATHFAMLFETARLAGFWDPKQHRLDHVPFGLVLGADGKKFKTRSGETEKLIDLIQTAIQKARAICDERELDLDDAGKDDLARALGISAIKYADLSCLRTQDYRFSYDKMLQFEGNTAAFLLYADVRISSILRKLGKTAIDATPNALALTHPAERDLAVKLAQFSETLVALQDDLLPSRLCDYLYQLATTFNQFFRDCRVEGDPQQSSREQWIVLTQRVLRQGLYLLGIHPVERM